MVECAGLEIQCTFRRTVGSNPTLSAKWLVINSALPHLQKFPRCQTGGTFPTVAIKARACNALVWFDLSNIEFEANLLHFVASTY